MALFPITIEIFPQKLILISTSEELKYYGPISIILNDFVLLG